MRLARILHVTRRTTVRSGCARDERAGLRTLVVVPTYNESDNIERITREILGMDCGVSMLIVDDNSPDGSGEIADALAGELT